MFAREFNCCLSETRTFFNPLPQGEGRVREISHKSSPHLNPLPKGEEEGRDLGRAKTCPDNLALKRIIFAFTPPRAPDTDTSGGAGSR